MGKTYTITIHGNTYRHRETLKRLGWKWKPDRKVWTMTLVEAHWLRLIAADEPFAKGLGCRLKETRVMGFDGASVRVIWTSKSYVEPEQVKARPGALRDDPEWCVDGRGYYTAPDEHDVL